MSREQISKWFGQLGEPLLALIRSTERLDMVISYVHEAMPCDVTVDLTRLRDTGPAARFLTALRKLVSDAGRQFLARPAGH